MDSEAYPVVQGGGQSVRKKGGLNPPLTASVAKAADSFKTQRRRGKQTRSRKMGYPPITDQPNGAATNQAERRGRRLQPMWRDRSYSRSSARPAVTNFKCSSGVEGNASSLTCQWNAPMKQQPEEVENGRSLAAPTNWQRVSSPAYCTNFPNHPRERMAEIPPENRVACRPVVGRTNRHGHRRVARAGEKFRTN